MSAAEDEIDKLSMVNLLGEKQNRLRRVLLIAVWIPLLVVGLFCATNAFEIYAKNRIADTAAFPAAYSPQPGQSILIVSPHPDDESLGASGLVQQAIRNHVPVHIVFLTDGDAFHIGVSRYYREFHVKPQDYVSYGLMREGEARSALATVGVSPQQITFLGYPDQGLLPIFRQHWLAADVYRSPYSKVTSVPYADAFRPGAPFCGQSVTTDLESAITQIRPTDIYVTHPGDDHPDHSAAPAYVNVALNELRTQGNAWASNIAVHYFLVHRGDWPVPQGLNENVALAPPSQMVHLDTSWQSLLLEPAQTSRKKLAISRYASQQEMMGRFLNSFVRPNELFGQLPGFTAIIPHISPSQITLNGNPSNWPAPDPIDLDPTGDTVLRDFQSSGDIQSVYACSDNTNLYIRVDMHSSLSPQLHYDLYLRGFDRNGGTSDRDLEVSFTTRGVNPGTSVAIGHGEQAAWSGNTVEISVPLANLGVAKPSGVYVEAASMFSKLIVDRTGMRYGLLQAEAKAQNNSPLS